MKEIQLLGKKGKDKFVLVDDEDYEYLIQWKWYCNNCGYALRYQKRKQMHKTSKYKSIFMHRIIIGVKEGELTDHRNRDRLDNRRKNLRKANKSTNGMNRPATSTKKYTKYKGIYWRKERGYWEVRIGLKGRVMYLGKYDTEKEAAEVYNKAALKYHKEFASLNELV